LQNPVSTTPRERQYLPPQSAVRGRGLIGASADTIVAAGLKSIAIIPLR